MSSFFTLIDGYSRVQLVRTVLSVRLSIEKGFEMHYYILIGTEVKKTEEFVLQSAEIRQLAKTDFPGDVRVSTVFLGIDHSFGLGNAPVLFETMVFGGDRDEYCQRYYTYYEAMAGHYTICDELTKR